MINDKSYDSILAVIKLAGIDIEKLYNYSKNMTINVVKEEKKVTKTDSPFSTIKPLKKGQSWADAEDEDEKDIVKEETPKTITKLNFKSAIKGTDINEVNLEVESEIKFEVEPETEPMIEVGFKTKSSKKVVKNLPVVSTVHEFIKMISSRKYPGIDFEIDDDAHCEHTYSGTLCKNVRQCGLIHVQRCIASDSCTNKKCCFVHGWDMEDEDAEYNFYATMDKYNELKPTKRVMNFKRV